MVRKTRSQIHLKRLFEDVVWDKQFSFIVFSITPFQVANALPPLWLFVFGVWWIWFSWILNASHFILFLFRFTTWYSCKCVIVYVHAFTSFVFHFSVFAHVLLFIHPSIVFVFEQFFFSHSCFMFSVYYLFLLLWLLCYAQQTGLNHQHFECSSIWFSALFVPVNFFLVEFGCFSFFSKIVLLIFQLSYLAYNLFTVFPSHLALAFHCMF